MFKRAKIWQTLIAEKTWQKYGRELGMFSGWNMNIHNISNQVLLLQLIGDAWLCVFCLECQVMTTAMVPLPAFYSSTNFNIDERNRLHFFFQLRLIWFYEMIFRAISVVYFSLEFRFTLWRDHFLLLLFVSFSTIIQQTHFGSASILYWISLAMFVSL